MEGNVDGIDMSRFHIGLCRLVILRGLGDRQLPFLPIHGSELIQDVEPQNDAGYHLVFSQNIAEEC